MKTLYVRVQPKSGQSTFFRCGIKFSKAWQEVENVDDATARRLHAEQMLEVSDTRPEDMEDTAAGDSATNTSGAAGGSGSPAAAPTDPAVRLEAIRAAIGQIVDTQDAALWTGSGKPKTEAIAAITGWPVSAAERDAAMGEAK